MTTRYIVRFENYEHQNQTEEFTDVDEALQFIKSGLFFCKGFNIIKDKR